MWFSHLTLLFNSHYINVNKHKPLHIQLIQNQFLSPHNQICTKSIDHNSKTIWTTNPNINKFKLLEIQLQNVASIIIHTTEPTLWTLTIMYKQVT